MRGVGSQLPLNLTPAFAETVMWPLARSSVKVGPARAGDRFQFLVGCGTCGPITSLAEAKVVKFCILVGYVKC